METPPPDQLKTAAIVQLVVGLIDLTLGVFLVSFFWTCVTGICTLGMCPIGGIIGFLIFPLGLMEVAAGIVGLANPKGGATLMKVVAALSIAGILVGSLTSAIGGAVAMMQLSSPQVKAYLEGA